MSQYDILEAIADPNPIPGGIVYTGGPFDHIHALAFGATKLAPTNHHLTKAYCDLIWGALNAFGDNR